MDKYLFNDSDGNNRFEIREIANDDIIFTHISCFDRNFNENDIYNAVIPKNVFIKGIEEYLETGLCRTKHLVIRNMEEEKIHISVSSNKYKVDWTVRNKNRFQEKSREILKANQMTEIA